MDERPKQNENVDGIIAIGPYKPNAFDRVDLELLTSPAQHAARALDNTYEHEAVELRAQLDSLTGVYNRGNSSGCYSNKPTGNWQRDIDSA